MMVWLAVLVACDDLAYLPGDWQLDVVATLPLEAETLRICVEGMGVTTMGAGNGRGAVRGVPPDATRVRVEVNDVDGFGLLATPWTPIGDDDPIAAAAPVELGESACAASGAAAAAGSDDRLLVTRFVEE